ncbi:MAG TPA: VWA domain-containing protein [Bryobacteraceae bacterium]|nr:VWA domain-containing protein [Bryobacteraceae bacterium]
MIAGSPWLRLRSVVGQGFRPPAGLPPGLSRLNRERPSRAFAHHLATILLPLCLFAQERPQEPIARVPVRLVIAPTSVTDQHGKFINGLGVNDFTLSDNDIKQEIHEDADFLPISLVVAIQNNHQVSAILDQIHSLGPLLGSLVVGQGSEAAILTFNKYVETLQTFTADPGRLTQSLRRVECHYDTFHMIDATFEAIRILKTRPSGQRRILLLISEKRDLGSQTKLRDIIEEAELNNVLIYSMNISRAHAARRIIVPADGPKGTAFSLDIMALVKEIYMGVKSIGSEEPLSVLTRYSGGREYSFFKDHSFEEALNSIGAEIHGQYLLNYRPSNLADTGYHKIRVELNRPELTVRSRPGYYTLEPVAP